jgi:DNA mismatch endonuclease (patch repair protein)
MFARKELHKAGYRYRIRVRGLPGTPVIVLPQYKDCCFYARLLLARGICAKISYASYKGNLLGEKIKRNIKRDAKAIEELGKTGCPPDLFLPRNCGKII